MIYQAYVWLLVHVCSILSATAIVSLLVSFFTNKMSRQHFISWWFAIIMQQVRLPLQVFVWLLGFVGVYHRVCMDYQWLQVASMVTMHQMIAAIPFFWGLFRIKSALESTVYEKAADLNIDKTVVSVISKIATVLLVAITVVSGLHIAGMPLQSLMVFGGAISIAVGLASKTVIENFFGGLMVYITRPFRVGNWISSPDKKIEGVVEEIGWYSTKIRTFERRPMYVPNALFTNIIVQNPSRMYNRRIRTNIGLRYEDIDKVEAVVQGIKNMLSVHPEIDQNQTCMVHWISFGDSSLNIDVYTFTVTTDWAEYRRVQQDVFLKIGQVVAQHGAQIAFPTRTIEVYNK